MPPRLRVSVAGRRLDLDDLGAELRQDHAAGRAHHMWVISITRTPDNGSSCVLTWRLPGVPWISLFRAN